MMVSAILSDDIQVTSLTFDRKKLARDTLSAISQFGVGRKFIGHGGREHAIVSRTDAAVSMFRRLMARDRQSADSPVSLKSC